MGKSAMMLTVTHIAIRDAITIITRLSGLREDDVTLPVHRVALPVLVAAARREAVSTEAEVNTGALTSTARVLDGGRVTVVAGAAIRFGGACNTLPEHTRARCATLCRLAYAADAKAKCLLARQVPARITNTPRKGARRKRDKWQLP